jgi:hypothetical protein
MPFESWCPRRQEKSLVPKMLKTSGHESAGPVRQSAGGKLYWADRFVLFGEDGGEKPIELHVCKHCGCVYAEVKP